jgi:N-acetylmuramoyl-L-alanine amidase
LNNARPCQQHKADLFISIHVNAHGKKEHSGIETYFLNLATDADAMRVAALENASSTHSIGELQHILSSLMNNSKLMNPRAWRDLSKPI